MKKTAYLFLLLWMALTGANGQPYTCYQVMEHNTGIPALYNTALDSVACSLKTLVNNTGSQGFVVLGYDLYPALAYVDPYETYRERYETAVTRAEAAYQSFVLVTKEHRQEGEIAYRLKIKFPSLSPFDELTPFERGGIEAKVLETLEQKAAAAEYSTGSNAGVEIAVLEKLKGYFQAVIDETFSLEGDLLALSGFERLTFDGPTTIEVSNNTSLAAAGGKIYDYAGLKNQDVFLRSNLQAAYDSIQLFDPPAVIITASNMTYSGGFNAAESTFDSLPFAFVLWLHFDADKDSLYIKGKTNLTEQEAQVMVDEWYEQATEEYWSDEASVQAAAPDDPNRDNNGSSRNFSCSDAPSGIYDCTKYHGLTPRKWRAYCCLLPLEQDYSPGGYNYGVSCGVIDGLWETVLFLYDANNAVNTTVLKASIPGYAFYQVLEKMGKELSLRKAMKEKYEKDKEFLEAIGKLIFIYQNWQILNSVSGNQLSKKLFDSIQEAISRVYIDMISSDVRGGYIVGRIVFELLLDYFTGGAQNYKNISKLGKSFFDFIVTLATKSVDEIADFLEVALRSAKNIFKAARCTLLATGCFVPGTQVMALDNNTRSIEYILPGDWVYAYRKQDERLQAGLENKIGAYTGTKSDFVYTTLSVKKNLFEIKLEIKQGTSERNDIIRLIRPGNWLDSIGISTIGDQMWLTMPEQGINGQAKVTELKPFRWSEPPIEENKQDRYDLCQVTGIFTHTSNNVWELIFDNADTVRCTFSHPIFSVDINDWRAAGELEPGERVLSKAGNAALTSKKMLPGRFTVYNLEVAELHNFLVGKSGIAVHNSCLVEELVGVLRSSYRKIFEERFIRPLEYLSLRPIEKVLADMSDVQFDRFVSQMKGVGVENKLWVKAELAKSWLFLDNIPSISNQLDLISYTVVDQFYTKLAKKISKWGLNDEEIRLLFQYYYKYDDTFNQTITELIGNDTKGLSRAFQKINEILKRTGGAKENSFFSSVIKGFSHPNPNNRKGWKWIVEYIGRSDNYIMNVLEGGFVTPKNIRFGRQITNKVTKRNRYVDVFLDGEEIKVGFELKSHKRIETLDKERFASEFVTDLLEFEDFRFAWIFELNALNYSKEVAQGHLMNLLKSNEVISLLNQCKNGNILEYTNKLESLFNLNPGENISIGNVVDLMEAELDNGGLTVFQSIFKFE